MVLAQGALTIGNLLPILVSLIGGVLAYDECYSVGNYVYYCEDGYHCCNNDQDCCLGDPDPGLSAGAIAGIAVGSVVGLVIIIVVLEQCCKGNVTVGAVTEEPRRVQVISVNPDPPSYSQAHYPLQQYPSAQQNPVTDYKQSVENSDAQQN